MMNSQPFLKYIAGHPCACACVTVRRSAADFSNSNARPPTRKAANPMSLPTFSFVIVTYNSADTIELCLASIAAHTAQSYEVAVVDNSPTDETARRFTGLRRRTRRSVLHPVLARGECGLWPGLQPGRTRKFR